MTSVVYLTAGGAGMYCGSCLNDNTLARALSRAGVQMLLVPLYTPIRTDEENVSIERVFFGGVNVFLQQKLPLLRYLPSWMDGWLDSPWLLRRVSQSGLETSAKQLGEITISMLRGAHGRQCKELRRMCRWLAHETHPDLIHLTNILIGGCAEELKRHLHVPIVATLQGDDVFLDDLAEPYKTQALQEIRQIDAHIDGYIVHSHYYADHMAAYLGLSREKIFVTPLGIDVTDYLPLPQRNGQWIASQPTIGYLARLAKEKGLHVLVDAFLELRRRPTMQNARLRIAGWLGPPHTEYAKRQFERLRRAGLGDAFEYIGIVERQQKLDFLCSIDVLSVPTIYREPKGLFVLEAMAAGVPVVQPDHGAFPELLRDTEGGRLVPCADPVRLAKALEEMLADHPLRHRYGAVGRQAVYARRSAHAMAEATLAVYQQLLGRT